MHPHYRLANGDLISKKEVDKARAILARLENGAELVDLSDEELFSNGDEFEAVYRFWKKYDCTVMEARTAIKHLRGN